MSYIYSSKPVEEQLKDILRIVSLESNISIDKIKGKSRESKIIIARQVYMFFAYKNVKSSLAQIGELVNRKHSTVIFANKKYVDVRFLTESEKEYYYKVKTALFNLYGSEVYLVDLINTEREKIVKSLDTIKKLMAKI